MANSLPPAIAEALAPFAPKASIVHKIRRVRPDSIHAQVEPVKAYAQELANHHKAARHVISIPEGSRAYLMGYRYVSIDDEELQGYIAGGAELITTVRPQEGGAA